MNKVKKKSKKRVKKVSRKKKVKKNKNKKMGNHFFMLDVIIEINIFVIVI